MKKSNFLLTMVLSLTMLVGFGNLAKAQCPILPPPACECPCPDYTITNSTNCQFHGICAYTLDPCVGACDQGCDTCTCPVQVVLNGNGGKVSVSYITLCGNEFCLDGLMFGSNNLQFGTSNPTGFNIPCSCCASGQAKVTWMVVGTTTQITIACVPI